jgi:diguanylate cyclase (GGDEF)-like protein
LRLIKNLLIFLFVFCSSVQADELPLSLRDSRVWDSSSGLPHNTAQSITQTNDGYLWVATWEGLARFNGRDWKVFNRDDITGLSDNGIRTLLPASDGSLWVGSSRDGLFNYSQGVWTSIPYGSELAQGQVIALHEDKKKQIWVLTADKAIFSIAKDGKITKRLIDLPDASVRLLSFAENSKGDLLLSSTGGLFKFNGVDSFKLQVAFNPDAKSILAMARNSNGGLLLATSAGLYTERGDSFAIVPGTENIGESMAVDTMLVEANDRIMLGTQGNGLYCFCGGKLESYNTKNGLVNNRIASLFLDRENNLWIGTNLGITRLHRGNITKYAKSNGLSDDYVRAIVNDPTSGVTWVGTSDGLNRIEHHVITRWGQEQGLPNSSIYSLLLKTPGELWIGSDNSGIAILRQNHFDLINQVQGLPPFQVRALVSDGNKVWAGLGGRTGGGIALIESGRVTELFAKSLSVRTLFLDSKSRLWIGATTGIYILQHDQIQRLQQPGLNLQYAFGFYEDERGVVWVAADNGLYRIADGKAVQIGLTRGLPTVPLLGVTGLDQEIWACSNQGVIKLRRADLDAVAVGTKGTLGINGSDQSSATYSRLQCNGGGNPIMAYKPPYLLFATSSGLAQMDTQYAAATKTLADTLFERWEVDGQEVPLIKNKRLEPGVNRIQFSYAAPTFVAPEQLLFHVRLKGFDDEWHPGTKSNEVTYTNLPPGDYELWVQANNGKVLESGNISKFPFSIKAYFWQRPIFWLLLAACIVLAIALAIRQIIRVSRKRELELEVLVADRTSKISDYAAKLESINQQRETLLNVLQGQTEGLAKLASEDSLTGLSNRRSYEDESRVLFENARKDGRPFCLAIIDIDGLKTINDTLGHQTGDVVIRGVAEQLKRATRGRDIVARVGGDEFVMVFPGMTADSVVEVCERLCREVAAIDFNEQKPGLKVTVSIGVSDLPHAQSFEKLIADADRSLYQAKNSGRNRVVSQSHI